jgi:FkbM family methyltransferase
LGIPPEHCSISPVPETVSLSLRSDKTKKKPASEIAILIVERAKRRCYEEVMKTRRTLKALRVSEKPKTPYPARLVISIAGVVLLLAYTIYFNPNSLLIANQTSGCRGNDHKIEQDTIDHVKNRRSKLGDDCYHIFLDVGANIGVHSRFLMEPDSYPLAEIARGHFDSVYGTQRDNRDFCMFAFEPNPVHKQRHEALAKAYEQMGWRYHYFGAGVGDKDGDLTFYHMDNSKNNEWGFSTIKQKCLVNGLECRPEIVPVIRLASWIDEHVHQRKLPEVVHGSLKEGGPKVGTYFSMRTCSPRDPC